MQVERGWQGLHEVNRVLFDPQQVTVEQMAERLKEVGTLVDILERSAAGKH